MTSFIDGSTIYGSSKDEAEELRTFFKGQLRVQTDALNEELLPADSNDLDCRMSEGESNILIYRPFRLSESKAEGVLLLA